MRIIHTADWHIGKILNDYSLLEDQRVWFSRFIERLRQLKPDAVLVAGDIYDRSMPSGEAVSLLNEILCEIVLELGIEVFLIAGNHDSRERLAFGSELLEKSGLHIAGTLRPDIQPYILKKTGKPVHIYLLPYLEPHNVKPLFPETPIKTQKEAVALLTASMREKLDPDAVNLLAAHGLFAFFAGEESESDASVGGSEMADASLFAAFDYVALGHLHAPRTIGRENMRYAGSPLKYSVDEAAQQKSFTIIDISPEGDLAISQESVPPLRDLRIIEGSFDALCHPDSRDVLDDYVFANLTDSKTIVNAMSRLKAIYPHIVGLRYPNRSFVSSEHLAAQRANVRKKTNEQLFAQFYQNVTDAPLSTEQEEIVRKAFQKVTGGDRDDSHPIDA